MQFEISTNFNAVFWIVIGLLLSVIVSTATRILLIRYNQPNLAINGVNTVRRNGSTGALVRITNDGRSPARNCTASIVFEGVADDDLLPSSPSDFVDPVHVQSIDGTIEGTLWWTTGHGATTATINRQDTATLKLCEISDQYLVVSSGLGSDVPSFVLDGSKSYHGSLRVTAENAEALTTAVSIDASGLEPKVEIRGGEQLSRPFLKPVSLFS